MRYRLQGGLEGATEEGEAQEAEAEEEEEEEEGLF